MRKPWGRELVVVAAVCGAVARAPHATTAAGEAVVAVRNPLTIARPSETIVIGAADVKRVVSVSDLRAIHVRDDRSGRDLLTQAIDLDDDGTFDQVVFQTDLAAAETRTFSLSVGERHVAARDEFRAYGRFVRERRDDFAWENDLVAHRMFGAALETAPRDALIGSGVDVWVKRTPRLVINDWYMVDDYHRDAGEGADFYASGSTRGCGGSGLWANAALSVSANFRASRVIANGPLRVEFELSYDPWPVNGRAVRDVTRVTLDAGQHLNRFEIAYQPAPGEGVQGAAGIRALAGADIVERREAGVLRSWEALADGGGHLGCAIVADPRAVTDMRRAGSDYLVITRLSASGPVAYWTGTAWDKGGDITSAAQWDRYLSDWAARIKAPVDVTIASR